MIRAINEMTFHFLKRAINLSSRILLYEIRLIRLLTSDMQVPSLHLNCSFVQGEGVVEPGVTPCNLINKICGKLYKPLHCHNAIVGMHKINRQ